MNADEGAEFYDVNRDPTFAPDEADPTIDVDLLDEWWRGVDLPALDEDLHEMAIRHSYHAR